MDIMQCAKILKDEAIRHIELSKACEMALNAIVELAELKASLEKRQANFNTISEELNERS